jgi:hypothetical protein
MTYFLRLTIGGCDENFSMSLMNHLSSGVDFTWISRPPHGRSGGHTTWQPNRHFKKAYDKVKWYFIQQMLRMKDFFLMSGVI